MSTITPQPSSLDPFRSERGLLRPLSHDEILTYADLIDRQKKWQAVFDFARTCYGPNAATVEIDNSDGDTDDQGGMDYYINRVTVSDRNGNDFVPDLDASYWETATIYSYKTTKRVPVRQWIEDYIKDHQDMPADEREEYIQDALIDYLREDNYGKFDLPYDVHDGDVKQYDITASPMQQANFPTLYIAATAAEPEGETA